MAEHPAVVFLREAHSRAVELARAARDAEFLTCGIWEPRGPYGENYDRGNIRSELREDIFGDAELRWEFVNHMALHDPAAVMRRVAAERQILAEHADDRGECTTCAAEGDGGGITFLGSVPWPCRTVLLLAEALGWTEDSDG